MTLTMQQIVSLCWQGITAPREAAHSVLALGVPRAALWPLAGLVAIAVAFMFVAQGSLVGMEVPVTDVEGAPQPFQVWPLMVAAAVYGFLLAYAWVIWVLGKRLGGKGSFEEAVLLGIYLQAILLMIQFVELALLVVAPPFATLVALAALFYGLYLNIQFIDVLHGFGSLLKSFFLWLAASAAFGLALMLILTLTGVRLAG